MSISFPYAVLDDVDCLPNVNNAHYCSPGSECYADLCEIAYDDGCRSLLDHDCTFVDHRRDLHSRVVASVLVLRFGARRGLFVAAAAKD